MASRRVAYECSSCSRRACIQANEMGPARCRSSTAVLNPTLPALSALQADKGAHSIGLNWGNKSVIPQAAPGEEDQYFYADG